MKKINTYTKYLMFSMLIVLASSAITQINAQKNDFLKRDDIGAIVANYTKSLNSENHGVRMCTVEYVGKFSMTNFESKLIEMLNSTENTMDKKVIALSLFQLGSLQSISELKNSYYTSSDSDYKEFCSTLLEKCGEYNKLRLRYVESLVVSIPETK